MGAHPTHYSLISHRLHLPPTTVIMGLLRNTVCATTSRLRDACLHSQLTFILPYPRDGGTYPLRSLFCRRTGGQICRRPIPGRQFLTLSTQLCEWLRAFSHQNQVSVHQTHRALGQELN